jgi:uncharacterized Zn finger protein
MATKNQASDGIEAECSTCGRVTPHDVSIDILTESGTEENAEFSREPYRISECKTCGTTSKTRMNNA